MGGQCAYEYFANESLTQFRWNIQQCDSETRLMVTIEATKQVGGGKSIRSFKTRPLQSHWQGQNLTIF